MLTCSDLDFVNDMVDELTTIYEVRNSRNTIIEALTALPDDKLQNFYEGVCLYGMHPDETRWLLYYLETFENNQLIA